MTQTADKLAEALRSYRRWAAALEVEESARDALAAYDAEKAQAAPAGWQLLKDTTYAEREWTEDAGHENGCYQNSCMHCLRQFVGHKRRVVCKSCAASPTPPPVQEERVPLTEEQVVKCIIEAECLGKVNMSFESGPYDITRASINADKFVRAIERAHGIKPPKE